MYALSLHQPWASLVVSGIKKIENRSWMPRVLASGDRFAIHATATVDKPAIDRIREIAGIEVPHPIKSALVGVVTFVRAIRSEAEAAALGEDQARWFFGPVGWVLRDAIAFAQPIKMGGAMGLWSLAPDLSDRIVRDLASSTR